MMWKLPDTTLCTCFSLVLGRVLRACFRLHTMQQTPHLWISLQVGVWGDGKSKSERSGTCSLVEWASGIALSSRQVVAIMYLTSDLKSL